MNPPIAGVSPASLSEVTVMAVWPSMARFRLARMCGRIIESSRKLSLFAVPIAAFFLAVPMLLLFFVPAVLPRIPLGILGFRNPWFVRYRLTNRRVVVEDGFGKEEIRSVSLDRFDSIEIADPDAGKSSEGGQDWFPAGDLVFKHGGVETFRLPGVSRPESFRHTCVKAQQSFAGVQKYGPKPSAA